MKGEWVMFRLKPKPGEKAEPWMLKKVTDDFADPDDGDALVDNCVTSVTTGRTMAEIAAGEDVWRSNRGGQKGGRAKRKASEGAAAVRRSRSWRRWSTTCRPATAGSTKSNMTATGCCSRVGDGVATAWTRNGKDWSDKFKALVKAAAQAARRLPDRRRGGRARRRGQAELPAAAVDAQGAAGRQPRLLRLRPADRPRRGHPQAAQYRAQGAARGAARRACRRRSSTATMSSAAARRCSTRVCKQGGEGIISKKASAPYSGTRTRNWLKIKCIQRQEFVIVGWSESDKRRGFRSLLLARERGRQADLCRQGRHRLQRQADRGADGADGAARDRTRRRSRCRAPTARARTGSSPSWSPRSPSPNSPTTASFGTRASLGCARTSRRQGRRAGSAEASEAKPRRSRASAPKRKKRRDRRGFRDRDQQPGTGDLPRTRPDQEGPRRLLCDRSSR